MKLLITIVDRIHTDEYTNLLNMDNDKFQVVTLGHGTANSEILDYFGLAETEKSVILCILDEEELRTVFTHLSEMKSMHRNGGAVAFTIPIANMNKKFVDLIKSLIVNHTEEKF